ncbi:MAG: thioredoxin family protein [Neptuniibacter sp.]|uniref:thioredoxin family protein n=1 Tax=Neptuniibacter sp. TaxID=1962643 RepID=UPI003B5B7FB4
MKEIKVLGSGCTKCEKTAELIQKIAAEVQAEVNIQKETDPEVIMNYAVMRTPAVVIDEQVVHSGSIPETNKVRQWLEG